MGLFDALFGNRNQIPTVTTILPDAARQEIIAGRLPILNTDKLFLKRGERIHFIDKAINMEQKTVKEFRHVEEVPQDYLREPVGVQEEEELLNIQNLCSTGEFYT